MIDKDVMFQEKDLEAMVEEGSEGEMHQEEYPYKGGKQKVIFSTSNGSIAWSLYSYHIQVLDWKTMNQQFPAAEIRQKIKALPPPLHNDEHEIEPRCEVPDKPRRVTTTLVEPATPLEHMG